jgi:hypothetical protein
MRTHWLAAAMLSIFVTPAFPDEPAPASSPISAITSLKSMIWPTGSEESKGECAAQCGDVCCNRPRLYGSVEYLLYWFENQRVPPLVAIFPVGAPLGLAGGAPGEIVLFGGRKIDFGGIDSMRVTTGYWLDSQQNFGIEASGFLTEQQAKLFGAVHDGAANNPVILGPTDGTFALGAAVGAPGLFRGGVIASEHTRLWGAEANGVLNWSDSCRGRIDLLAGFRYLDLDESLDVQDFTQSLLFPTTQIIRTDSFDGRTQFWGPQVGSRATLAWGAASLSLIGKIGVGVSHLSVDREGETVLPGNPPGVTPGGVLVNTANAGHDTTNRFAALSETTLQIGYQWTKCIQTTVGYNFLYLTSAARVGDQVQPVGGINATDFYANGITFGVSCRY